MAARTGIEWTDATWNPVTGCTKVSAGCDNCYAEELANRLLSSQYRARRPVVDSARNRLDPFAVRLWPERLEKPGSWAEPRMVFVNSMSDLFHKDIPLDFVRRCFEVMLREERHVYQVLTKRPARAAAVLDRLRDMMPAGLPAHIWIGTSIEDDRVKYRIRHLLTVAAKIRFLSCEPLIGPLQLAETKFEDGIQWVIVGGESGIGRRPMDRAWVRSIRDDCARAGVAFFFKQWGGRTPKAHGRELDGRTWDQLPKMPDGERPRALVGQS